MILKSMCLTERVSVIADVLANHVVSIEIIKLAP